MRPTDSKSLLQFIFEQMDRLNKKEIDCNQAHAQAKLAREANNILNYEIKRADMLLRIRNTGILLRDIEIPAIEEKSGFENPYKIISEINGELPKS